MVTGPETTMLAAVVVGIGLVLLGAGLRALYRSLRVAREAPTDVRAVTEDGGVASLEGTARPIDGVLESPYAGEECLAYEATQLRKAGADDWRTEAEDRDGVPFLLEDDTAAILVDPSDATLELATGTSFHATERSDDPTADLQDARRRDHGRGLRSRLGFRQVPRDVLRRFRELRLDPGETVHVRGPIDTDAAGARVSGAVSAAVRGTDKASVLLSDTDRRTTLARTLLTAALGIGLGIAALAGAVGIASGAA